MAAIEQGFQKEEIERSRLRRSPSRSTTASATSSGSTSSPSTTDEPYEPLRVDPTIEAQQRESLATLRAERDNAAVEQGPRRAAAPRPRAPTTCSYPMKEALAARATVGEVCHALRGVWGTYVPADSF